jgi:hypothetical protein
MARGEGGTGLKSRLAVAALALVLVLTLWVGVHLGGHSLPNAPAPQPGTVATAPVSPPASAPAQFYAAAYRSDWVDIPLAAKGDPHHGDELEYKVRMKAGDSLVFSWKAEGGGDAPSLNYDFHGETPPPAGASEGREITYKQASGLSSNGVLIAPVNGAHGWELQNLSAKPVTVKLKLAGFYELVPPGDFGNEAGLEANVPGGYSKAS